MIKVGFPNQRRCSVDSRVPSSVSGLRRPSGTNGPRQGFKGMMENTRNHGQPDGFDVLVDEIRSRLLPALVSKWGIEVGSDLCSDVEEYAWQNQRKVISMENPLGYLYRVAQSKSRSHSRWGSRMTFPSRFPDIVHEDMQLHETLQMLAGLNPDQRVCVLLVHAFGWTYAEVAELLGVTRSVVNHHVHRGLAHLRQSDGTNQFPSPTQHPSTQETT